MDTRNARDTWGGYGERCPVFIQELQINFKFNNLGSRSVFSNARNALHTRCLGGIPLPNSDGLSICCFEPEPEFPRTVFVNFKFPMRHITTTLNTGIQYLNVRWTYFEQTSRILFLRLLWCADDK